MAHIFVNYIDVAGRKRYPVENERSEIVSFIYETNRGKHELWVPLFQLDANGNDIDKDDKDAEPCEMSKGKQDELIDAVVEARKNEVDFDEDDGIHVCFCFDKEKKEYGIFCSKDIDEFIHPL